MADNADKTLTHIVGTFLIQAEGAFLNGAGLGQGEDRNMTVPKTLTDFKDKVPYVSSQAWKRWLRNTFQDEYPNENHAVIKALALNAKGNPEKIGTEMNPVIFAEDDIFGYMRAQQGQGKVAKEESGGLLDGVEDEAATEVAEPIEAPTTAPKGAKGERVKSVMRPAPFAASILMSLRKTGWEGVDEGFVHLKEGTPLPYSTRFYNTQLQGIFGLHYGRLGVFRNEGDRVEIDPSLVEKHKDQLQKQDGRNVYVLKDNERRERATMILRSLAVLRKPAKEAQFATDIAPKVLIVAGLTSGNLIFNDLFDDTKDGPKVKIEMLREVIADYADRLVTPVFIGIRTGYLEAENEKQLRAAFSEGQTPRVEIVTPLQAVERLTQELPQ
jgi:CRISPR-associated protein Cst2